MKKTKFKTAFDRQLHIISFKSFLKEMAEDTADLYKQYQLTSGATIESLKQFQDTEDFKSLDESIQKDSANLLRMKNKTVDEWSKIEWTRCRKFVREISKEVFKENKNTSKLKALGHLI